MDKSRFYLVGVVSCGLYAKQAVIRFLVQYDNMPREINRKNIKKTRITYVTKITDYPSNQIETKLSHSNSKISLLLLAITQLRTKLRYTHPE